VDTGFTRTHHHLYLITGVGLSVMFSFIAVVSFYPILTYTVPQPLDISPVSQIQLHPIEPMEDIELAVFATPDPPAGKLASIVFDTEDEFIEETDSVRLVFGGDVDEGRWGDNPDWHFPLVDSFVNLLPLFRDTDLVLFNAEGGLCDPLNDGVVLEPRGSNILWVTPASLIDLQSELDDTMLVINQANNHTMNLGESCMQYGTTRLSDAGIAVLGVGENLDAAREPFIVEINGTVIGILAYADTNVIIDAWVANSEHSGVSPMDPFILEEDMQAVRPEVDFLIVTFHSGKEFERAVTQNQVEFALAAVRLGADLVVGHGSHVPQGVIEVDNTPIYFGLGNGMMDQCFPEDYAFYSHDVRKNVWLEVEIKKSELISAHPHIFYSTKCMVPNVAPPLIDAEVVHAFENIVFMDDLSMLSYFDIDGIVKEVFSDNLAD
jgi:poly-gamma-glutamate capsule biosynthesis protein CapA/YwtB (metallophosphatase superfamily)